MVYVFPRDLQTSILSKSLLFRLRGALKVAAGVGEYVVRVAFGSALLTSIVLVWVAVTVLLSSNRDSDRNR